MAHLKGWGYNAQGQVGNGSSGKLVLEPVDSVALGEEVKAAATGGNYSLAHQADGTVLAVGDNVNASLCTGDLTSTLNARPSLLSGVKQLEAADGHGIALLDIGEVLTWGANAAGQIGDGSSGAGEANKAANKPMGVGVGLSNIALVRAGGAVSGALTAGGLTYLWGENRHGACLANPTLTEVLRPWLSPLPPLIDFVLGGAFSLSTHGLGLTAAGAVIGWGAGRHGAITDPTGKKASETEAMGPTVIPGLANVVKLGAGTDASYALRANGDLLAWGLNTRYQLGIAGLAAGAMQPTPTVIMREVSDFSVGGGTGAAISRGEVYTWGGNQYGECGLGQAGTDIPTPTQIPSLGNVESVTVGMTHMLALLRGPMKPPTLRLVREVGALRAEWESPPVAGKWEVSWRLVGSSAPHAKVSIEDPSTRAWTIGSLLQVEYEVTVHNVSWGRATVEGKPL